jgi:hypothetical protein
LFVGANKDETGIYRDVLELLMIKKEILVKKVLFMIFKPCPPNGDPTSPLNQ